MSVERPCVERSPARVRTSCPIRHYHVRVQQRIPGPRRLVPERGRDKPVTAYLHDAIMAAPRPARLPLQIRQRVCHRRVMALAQHIGELELADAEEDAHALWPLEGQIEARHA